MHEVEEGVRPRFLLGAPGDDEDLWSLDGLVTSPSCIFSYIHDAVATACLGATWQQSLDSLVISKISCCSTPLSRLPTRHTRLGAP